VPIANDPEAFLAYRLESCSVDNLSGACVTRFARAAGEISGSLAGVREM
jgi:hypothetical protein